MNLNQFKAKYVFSTFGLLAIGALVSFFFAQLSYAYRKEPIPGRHNCWTYYFTREELISNRTYFNRGVISCFSEPHIDLLLRTGGPVYNIIGDTFMLEALPPPPLPPPPRPSGPNLAELERQREAELQRQREEEYVARQEAEARCRLELGRAAELAVKAKTADQALQLLAETQVHEAKLQKRQNEKLHQLEERAARTKAWADELLCFPAETPVSVKDDSKQGYHLQPISTVRPGDFVVSRNLETRKGTRDVGRVQNVIRRTAYHLFKLKFGKTIMRVTGNHRIYVVNRNRTGWVKASDLRVGDRLLDISSKVVRLESIQTENGQFTVYNLDVQGNHNYYACDVLVHNCNIAAIVAPAPMASEEYGPPLPVDYVGLEAPQTASPSNVGTEVYGPPTPKDYVAPESKTTEDTKEGAQLRPSPSVSPEDELAGSAKQASAIDIDQDQKEDAFQASETKKNEETIPPVEAYLGSSGIDASTENTQVPKASQAEPPQGIFSQAYHAFSALLRNEPKSKESSEKNSYPFICSNPDDYVGHSLIGNGQCVKLVQKATGAPSNPRETWVAGVPVHGHLDIPKGTAIATFRNGIYPSASHGNHAAIYLCQDDKGVTVVEQYVGLKAIRTKKYLFKGAKVQRAQSNENMTNDGDFYCVIHPKGKS